MNEIQTKVFRVLLLGIHSHLYSFALRFVFLHTHTTSYSSMVFFCTVYTIKEKGEKPDRKPQPLPYGLRNPYRNLKSENLQETSKKLYVHEFGFWTSCALAVCCQLFSRYSARLAQKFCALATCRTGSFVRHSF